MVFMIEIFKKWRRWPPFIKTQFGSNNLSLLLEFLTLSSAHRECILADNMMYSHHDLVLPTRLGDNVLRFHLIGD